MDATVVRVRLTLCIFLYTVGSSVMSQIYPKAREHTKPENHTCNTRHTGDAHATQQQYEYTTAVYSSRLSVRRETYL